MPSNWNTIVQITDINTIHARLKISSDRKKNKSTFSMEFTDNVAPKIHIIESHLIFFMRRFGRLGIFTDDTIERTWIEDHKWEHTYSCVLNW